MKILFLVYHGLSAVSGISKKILAQVDGLRRNGHDVRLCMYMPLSDGNRVWAVDGTVIKNYGSGRLAKVKSKIDLSCVADYVESEKIDFVYARSFHNANPFTINLFKRFKLMGVPSVIEIPTYPYDQEYADKPLMTRIQFCIDKLFRTKLASKCNAIVTFSDDKIIFGQRTINISNGIEFESIPLCKNVEHKGLNFIAVAEVHYWHGYDRLLTGLGEYYKNGGTEDIHVDIIGGVADTEMLGSKFSKGFKQIVDYYGIASRVTFHGQLFGEKLDDCFDKADFAIGSLGRHRSGVYNIKTLKNREYAARGIAFCYSEEDTDFDDKQYTLKFPPDETSIDVEEIVKFIKKKTIDGNNIRSSVAELSWENQMSNVLKSV